MKNKGFTLIELSIVLAIIGLVVAMGVSSLNASLKSKKRNATIEKLEMIQKAIQDFRGREGRLPCVGERDSIRTDPDYAREINCDAAGAGSATTFAAVPGFSGPGRVLIGVVPTRSLSLPDSFFRDGWDNRFLYAVTEDMADTNTAAGDPDIDVQDENDLTVAGGRAFSYVILSHGQDRKGSYLFTTGAVAEGCGAGTQDQENCGSIAPGVEDALFRDTLFNDGQVGANFFDDLIKWKAGPSAAPPTAGNTWIGVSLANNENEKTATNNIINFVGPANIDTGYDSNDNGAIEASERFWNGGSNFDIPAGITKIAVNYSYYGRGGCRIQNNGSTIGRIGRYSVVAGSSMPYSGEVVLEVVGNGSDNIRFNCRGPRALAMQIQAIECERGCPFISAP